jgi:hypothetical protein
LLAWSGFASYPAREMTEERWSQMSVPAWVIHTIALGTMAVVATLVVL